MSVKHDDERKPRCIFFFVENRRIVIAYGIEVRSKYGNDVLFKICVKTLKVENKMEERKIGRRAKKNIRMVA